VPVADPHLVVRQAVDREVFAELPEREVVAPRLFRKAATRIAIHVAHWV
jgi:hypothetical protein